MSFMIIKTDGNGAAVHQGMAGASTIYITRGDGTVSLNRITGGSSGMWRCDIPDSSGMMQSLYIYKDTDTVVRIQFTKMFTVKTLVYNYISSQLHA